MANVKTEVVPANCLQMPSVGIYMMTQVETQDLHWRTPPPPPPSLPLWFRSHWHPCSLTLQHYVLCWLHPLEALGFKRSPVIETRTLGCLGGRCRNHQSAAASLSSLGGRDEGVSGKERCKITCAGAAVGFYW